MKNFDKNRGISILGILIVAVIVILALSYYHISIKSVVESPTGQDNINYVSGTTESFWNTYLEKPASYLWNDVWVNIFWKSFINNMERIRDGQATDYDKAAKNLQIQ
jgi:hypothetical protein